MNSKFAILLLSLIFAVAGFAATDDEDHEYSAGKPVDEANAEPVIRGEGVEPSFAEVDTDSDGKISEEEAAEYEAVADNFQFVDEDNDGYLSDVEFMDLKE